MTMTSDEFRRKTAEIYWDDQDPGNTGWWLRYFDASGVECGTGPAGGKDADPRKLAAITAFARDVADGTMLNIYHAGAPFLSCAAILSGGRIIWLREYTLAERVTPSTAWER